MKRLDYIFAFIMVGMLLITSCASAASETPPTPTIPSPTSPTITHPTELTLTDRELFLGGNTDFAFDLYQKLKTTEGNFFFSPYSISSALAMTYAGARGETEQQMAATLHFMLSQERLHPSFSNLNEELKQRGQVETYVNQPGEEPTKEMVDGFRLNIANALWGQKDYSFLPEYLDLIKTYYGGELNALDFINEPEPSRLEINKWASDQTEGRINDILGPGVITPLTRLVLTNAIYFNAHWEHEFAKSMTSNGYFYPLDGSKVLVSMMHQEEQYSYTEGGTYQAIRLPYLGNEFAMTILLPKEGYFEGFENTLDARTLKDITGQFESQRVALSLPKFTFESSFQLDKVLSEMGMPAAFSGAADFSGMTGNKELSIGAAIHKAFVAVDEVGTEAAAVTAIIMVMSAPPQPTVSFTADQPFIFLIQDIETGTVLFIGRTLNPAA